MSNSRGFTLIELIATVAVGSFLVTGIVLFTQQQIRAGVESRDRIAAVQLAKRRMAQIHHLPDAALTGSTLSPYDAAFPGYQCRTTITNALTSGSVVLREIVVEIDLVGGSFASPLASLRTYRVNVVSFGNGV